MLHFRLSGIVLRNKNSRSVALPLQLLITALMLSATSLAFAAPSQVYVTVRESKLRAKPDFFSSPSGNLKYGDRLDVLDDSGAWLQVKASGRTGYVHQSAISERKVVLRSSGSFGSTQADQNDVVLAGKGFNAEVERQFAASHQGLNFAAVNAMERIKVSPQELASFAEQGQLGKGGRR